VATVYRRTRDLPPGLALVAVDVLGAATFGPHYGHAYQGDAAAVPEAVAALREAARDPRPEVREAAVGKLASRGDPAAIDVLGGSLAAVPEGKGLFPPAMAAGYLALAGKGPRYPALRPYFSSPDAEVRAVVVAALAGDEASRDTIRGYLLGGGQPPGVRVAAARAPGRADPAFDSYALQVVLDSDDDPGVRAASLKA
jgi:hypothetical protein